MSRAWSRTLWWGDGGRWRGNASEDIWQMDNPIVLETGHNPDRTMAFDVQFVCCAPGSTKHGRHTGGASCGRPRPLDVLLVATAGRELLWCLATGPTRPWTSGVFAGSPPPCELRFVYVVDRADRPDRTVNIWNLRFCYKCDRVDQGSW